LLCEGLLIPHIKRPKVSRYRVTFGRVRVGHFSRTVVTLKD
jgi:hypothetical protein